MVYFFATDEKLFFLIISITGRHDFFLDEQILVFSGFYLIDKCVPT